MLNKIKIFNLISNGVLFLLLFFIVNGFAYSRGIEPAFYVPKKIGFFYWIGWGYFLISAHALKYVYEVKIDIQNHDMRSLVLGKYKKFRNLSFLFALLLICSLVI